MRPLNLQAAGAGSGGRLLPLHHRLPKRMSSRLGSAARPAWKLCSRPTGPERSSPKRSEACQHRHRPRLCLSLRKTQSVHVRHCS